MITARRATRAVGVGRLTIQAEVDGSGAERLWFDVPTAAEDLVVERDDAFAVGLLLPAMRMGEDLHLGGTVNDELLSILNGPLQDIIHLTMPAYRRVHVTARTVASAESSAPGVAMGFSNGVDSFAALEACYLDCRIPVRQRVSHLLFNNVGSHGDNIQTRTNLFHRRLADVKATAAEYNLPVIDVDSNLDDHFHLGSTITQTAFANTHTIRNAAVACLLSGGIGAWHYASSNHVTAVSLIAGNTIDAADSLVLPLLSTSALRMSVANLTDTRVGKTRLIADLEVAQRRLDVCIADKRGAKNCSSCWKCMRTQTTLEMLGRLDEFHAVFDLDTYRANRADYAARVLAADTIIDGEVRDLAEQVGWVWPAGARRKASLSRARRTFFHIARTVKKRVRTRVKGRGKRSGA